ncbi:MAG TPA: hypothetical protein ENL22_09450 [candidate division Zixibacteria bacterium]|nr:hypothetical protein [candidate division Zixibacteria bacterium]
MFGKKIFGILTTFCLIGLMISGLPGCSEKIVNESAKSNVTISMSAKVSGFEMSELVTSFTLTVEAEDFTAPIVVPLTLEGAFLVGQAEIPAGEDRHFTVGAYDIEGNLIYQGDTYADVIYNSTVTIDIDLFPVVPMMKIIPRVLGQRVSSIAMGELFTVDVYVHNILDVRSISLDFSYLTTNYLIFLSDVGLGRDLPVDSRLSFLGESNATVTVSLDRPYLAGPLVDVLGNAHLLTFYFSTHSDTEANFDTTSLDMTEISLDRGSGDIIDLFPLDSLYLESAIVELYKVSDS